MEDVRRAVRASDVFETTTEKDIVNILTFLKILVVTEVYDKWIKGFCKDVVIITHSSTGQSNKIFTNLEQRLWNVSS